METVHSQPFKKRCDNPPICKFDFCFDRGEHLSQIFLSNEWNIFLRICLRRRWRKITIIRGHCYCKCFINECFPMKMKRTLCGKLYAQRRYLSCTRCRHREVCRNETGIVLIKFRGSVAHPWSIKWRAHAYTVILCTKFTLSGTFLVCTVYIFEEKRGRTIAKIRSTFVTRIRNRGEKSGSARKCLPRGGEESWRTFIDREGWKNRGQPVTRPWIHGPHNGGISIVSAMRKKVE